MTQTNIMVGDLLVEMLNNRISYKYEIIEVNEYDCRVKGKGNCILAVDVATLLENFNSWGGYSYYLETKSRLTKPIEWI